MKNLTEQYEDCIATVYAEDKYQRGLLMRFIVEFYKEEELIDLVMDRLSDGDFKMGDNAKEFFCRCADDLFRERLKLAVQKGTKQPEDIKKYHPLFGASVMTT